jgi:hypothetical protein
MIEQYLFNKYNVPFIYTYNECALYIDTDHMKNLYYIQLI